MNIIRITLRSTSRFTVLLLLLLPAVTHAQYGYLTNSDHTSITITGYTGAGGALSITNMLGGLPVSIIGTNAFRSNNSLTSIVIPDSVISIQYTAFDECTNLTNLVLGNLQVAVGNAGAKLVPGDQIQLRYKGVGTNHVAFANA